MKVSPLIAPPEGFHAEPMTHVQWIGDTCGASAWTPICIDGEQIEHRHGRNGLPITTHGIAHVRIDRAPIEASDPKEWAEREAVRRARAEDNRYVACIVNRYRRGRILVTKEEMDKWRQYHLREHDRRKTSGSGDLVEQAAAGELRPVMGPHEYAEWIRSEQ